MVVEKAIAYSQQLCKSAVCTRRRLETNADYESGLNTLQALELC